MEPEAKKMMNIFLFLFVIMTVFPIITSIMPFMRDFFKGSPFLMNIVAAYPIPIIILMASIATLFNTLFYKYGMDKETLELIKKSRQESKELQKRMSELRNEPEKLAALQKEMLAKSMQTTSASMKSMLKPKTIFLSYIPSIIFIFLVVGPIYQAAGVGYMIPITLPIAIPGIGKVIGGWLFCMTLFAIILSPILRKLLKVEI